MRCHRGVAGGRERALQAAEPRIRQISVEIENAARAQYAPAMRDASWLRRCWLAVKMSWEIHRRIARAIERIAPRSGLYACRFE
jgi:hypothetical protein